MSYTVLAADQGKFVKCTASAQTITTPDATVVGSPFVFFVVNESTGNITVAGNNPGVQQNIDSAASITLPSGTGCILNTDGTNWFTGGQNFANSTIAPVAGSFKKLSVKVATNTTVAVAADFVAVTDGSKYQTLAFSTTINLATNGGVAALDTGTIAIDTWYAIWVIAKSDGTTSALASTSFTSPTMPTGYTFKARVGSVRTIHGSATLYGTWQLGRRAQYIVGLAQTTVLPTIASGAVGTISSPASSIVYVSASVSAFVPTTASAISLIAMPTITGANGGNIACAPNASYTTLFSTTPPPLIALVANNDLRYGTFMLESTNVYWASSGSGGGLLAVGWEDNI